MYWKKAEPKQRRGVKFFCSVCGGMVYYIDGDAMKRYTYASDEPTESKCKYNYCPHCGEKAELNDSLDKPIIIEIYTNEAGEKFRAMLEESLNKYMGG